MSAFVRCGFQPFLMVIMGAAALLWRNQPAFADWPLVLVPMLGAMSWLS